jgi:hypothetical protein
MELSGRLRVNKATYYRFPQESNIVWLFFLSHLIPEECSYYTLNNPKYLKSCRASEDQKDSKFGNRFS